MKSIYVIRHGKSSWDDLEIPDVVRPLSSRGKSASTAVGKQLAQMHEKPDLIISSPAARAYHTAVNIARIIGYRLKSIRVEPALYYEGEQGIIQVLRGLGDSVESVFLVGHEPNCSDLVRTLTGQSLPKFPTAAVFKIALDTSDWPSLYEARGSKEFFITPADLEKGA